MILTAALWLLMAQTGQSPPTGYIGNVTVHYSGCPDVIVKDAPYGCKYSYLTWEPPSESNSPTFRFACDVRRGLVLYVIELRLRLAVRGGRDRSGR